MLLYIVNLKYSNNNLWKLFPFVEGTSDAEFIRGPGRVPNTNKHSVEGSNPIWMHAYENEWFKSDESISHMSERDSLDENALNNEDIMNEANANQRNDDKPYYIEPRVSSISRYIGI